MALIFLNLAEVAALSGVLGAFPSPKLKLYKNNYTPVDGSVAADFTEADFSGYASQTAALTTVGEVSGKAVANEAGPHSFTFGGGATTNTVYGYYVTDGSGLTVLWAERFSASINMTTTGNVISLQLFLTLDSENH